MDDIFKFDMFHFLLFKSGLLVALINEDLNSQQWTVCLTPPLSYNIFYVIFLFIQISLFYSYSSIIFSDIKF